MAIELLIASLMMLAAGTLSGGLASRIGFPRITGYLLAGILLNPRILPVITPETVERLSFVTPITLGVIAYLIGGGLRIESVRRLGRAIAGITADRKSVV